MKNKQPACFDLEACRASPDDGLSARSARAIAVCVDDFGLNTSINAAALHLAEMRRVSALSAMTQAPEWEDGAARARCMDSRRIDVGLHFNLTQSFGGAPALGSVQTLVAATHLRLLPKRLVREALLRQLDAFEEQMFSVPAHVDSHEHVHHLPVIRDVVLDVLLRRYGSALPWVRVSAAPASSLAGSFRSADERKAWLIDHLVGAEPFRRRARSLGFVANRRLLGVYGFDATESGYGFLLRKWLRQARSGDLLMCHPASSAVGDVISRGRRVEFAVWSDPHLPHLLRELGVRIAPMSTLRAATA
ncbi:putative glycoside hydrolase/deacetylase ChbG (UPF0249 family) [Variovorax boronicumulans]|uniref:ChbG/HpnK family deacetylase n=1 Tax=Variovorax boronicumulans TaxID=436515 RepID=UPI0027816447|nr:ChbG/HpnK family deacetylase [Variovorax boronicumulans]MDQ0012940.1 putative glycoside hydrolase/deacetylase ChbG (UPF0249 family) [Variovorax boronicumulans]